MSRSSPTSTGPRLTRRRALLLGGGAVVGLAAGAWPVVAGRLHRRSVLAQLFDAGPPPGCVPVSAPCATADPVALGAALLASYPWHDMRDLRWLAAAGVDCEPPGRRLGWYPELARCAELRNAAAACGDVLELVLRALDDATAPPELRLAGPAGIHLVRTVSPDRSAPVFARRLLDAPAVRLDAVSTAPVERSTRSGSLRRLARWLGRPAPPDADQPTWTVYAEAAGTSARAAPAGLDRLEERLRDRFGTAVECPQRLWLGDYRVRRGRLEALPTDRYLDLEQHRRMLALVDSVRPAAGAAAATLAGAHPGHRQPELEALLLTNLLVELFWLGPEDPWQDLGAAEAYAAPEAAALGPAVAAARRDGTVAIGPLREPSGRVVDLRLPGAWRLATLVGPPLETQGLGPAQLIVGLVEAAAATRRDGARLWDRYLPGRPLDRTSVVHACLGLESAVAATAMVYDHLLERMEASILADPATAWPADLYPFPPDRTRARRLLALSLLRTFKAFPEMLWRYPAARSFPYWHHTLNQDAVCDGMAVVAAIWGLELDLGLEPRVVPAGTWRQPLVDHHHTPRPDGLRVLSLPADAGPDLPPRLDPR